MTEYKKQGDFLARFGKTLIDNGYSIVPIQAGKKAPGFDGWQKSRSTKAQLEDWLANGHKASGIGVITKHTPAIDIDVYDEAVSKKLGKWVIENIADAPMRIGLAPKRLFMFRCDEPFRKITSTKYGDEWGQEHRIEILGDGQQFVAYHIHPDTKKPYIWPDFDGPLETQADNLPLLTEEKAQALIAYFDECAEEEGWTIVKKARSALQGAASITDNPWAEDTDPIDITSDELRTRLLLVPDAEDHETWVNVGMSLFHQFDGEDIGKELWHEWSETADNYDADELERRWGSFNVKGKKRAPITARYILRLAKEAVESTTAELTLKLRDAFLEAKDLPAWEKARKLTQEAEIDGLSRSALGAVAKERRDSITGTKTSLVEIKKAIAYLPKKVEKTPKWATNWVYDTSDDRFFSTESKIATSQQGFNAMFDRQAMTKKDALEGRHSPSSTASALALNLYRIPVVAGRRYMPGRDAIFHEPDGIFANLYAEHEIAERPDKILPRDKRNVERVKNHIGHLLADPRERAMLLDWLSWVVQNPGRHANYAILLQGVQGDGKTFFAEMLRAVMGVSNVTMLNAQILHNDFTDWCVGQCVNCVEEVRLINDKNKFEIINRIKPYITNNVIEVHPKGHAVYNAKNTTNYLLFTNYRDALPLDDTDRRYLILFSRWQKREDIKRFKRENRDYYEKLYEAIENSPGAIRAWLLDHEQSEVFDPMGDAPETEARRMMIQKSKPEMVQLLDEIISEDSNPAVSDELLEVGALSEAMMAMGAHVPPPKTLSAILERYGWEKLGRVKVNDTYQFFWTTRQELFHYEAGDVHYVDTVKVREFLRRRSKMCEENVL